MNEFRSFIALEIPQSLQKEFANLIDQYKKSFPIPIRWVQPSNIHLTLKFMGNISSVILKSLSLELRTIFAEFKSVPLFFTKVGVFPNINIPKVLWIGLNLPSEIIKKVDEIEKVTSHLGISSDSHPFSPHLTLGRINREGIHKSNNEILKSISTFECNLPKGIRSEYVTIFRSDLTRNGPIYSPLLRIRLKEDG
jgi:2'-5' RNA ligase